MIPPATSVAVVAGTIPSRTPDPLRLRSQMIVSRRDGRTCSGHLRVRHAIPLLVASVLGIAAGADAADVPVTYAEAQRIASPLPWRADWWTIFGSPELDALVARGNIDNADIAIIAARLSIARAAVRTISAERQRRKRPSV
jgi:multidrug efflux system outer membrane protein